MMKKKILLIGANDIMAAQMKDAFNASNVDVVKFSDSLMDLASTAQRATENFTIFNRQMEDLPDIDPSLPWPKSFQDPKGEKTGMQFCEMTSAKRKSLKSKRKKKKRKR